MSSRRSGPASRRAFRAFDAEAVAAYTEADVDRLTTDTRVIRNRRKLEATVYNAQRMLELEREHGSFKAYLRSHGGFEETVKDMRKRFKFLGDSGAYPLTVRSRGGRPKLRGVVYVKGPDPSRDRLSPSSPLMRPLRNSWTRRPKSEALLMVFVAWLSPQPSGFLAFASE